MLSINSMQRVLEQRVTALLDKLLEKPSLMNPPPIEEGGILAVKSHSLNWLPIYAYVSLIAY